MKSAKKSSGKGGGDGYVQTVPILERMVPKVDGNQGTRSTKLTDPVNGGIEIAVEVKVIDTKKAYWTFPRPEDQPLLEPSKDLQVSCAALSWLSWAGLGWAGLSWAGLGWAELSWAERHK